MATFRGTTGTDVLVGAINVADTFEFLVGELNAGDTVFGNGGSGSDRVTLLGAGTVNFGLLPGLSGIESYVLAAAGNTVSFADANGSNGAVSVSAGAGNDVVNAAALTASVKLSVTLGTGTDSATGGKAADTFRITAAGLTAADTIDGGDGNDTLFLTTAASFASSTVFDGLSSIERLSLVDGGNLVTLSDSLVAAANKDSLVVQGGSGNDTVNGAAVLAGRITTLSAGGGNDTLIGGAGVDVLEIAASQLDAGDTMDGGAGSADRIDITAAGTVGLGAFAGVANVEQVKLKVGGITLHVDNALASIAGGSRVAIEGSKADDVVSAATFSSGTVSVRLLGGNDTVTGPAAGGTLIVSVTPGELTAADLLTGGTGAGELSFIGAGRITTTQLGGVTGFGQFNLSSAGNSLTLNDAVVTANARTATLGGFGETLSGLLVKGSGGVDRIDARTLGAGKALLVDDAGADDDILRGGADNDRLNGGSGDDVLAGGAGNDVYVVDSGDDRVVEAAAGGIDTVRATTSFLLGSHVETLILVGSGAIDGTGNELANTIVGNGGVNVLDGGDGDDTLAAGAGDTAVGGAGVDRLVPGAAATFDLGALAGASDLEIVDLRGNGGTALSLTAAAGTGFTHRQIRILGEAGDTLVTEAGWGDFGTVAIDGQSVRRFAKDGTTLYVDAAVTGVATSPAFGTAVAGRQVIDLTSLSAAQGFIVQGDIDGDRAGTSVAGAGDLNGDGFADLVVGAPQGDDGGNLAGEAYVVFGGAGGFGTSVGGRQVLDLTGLSAAQGFILQGDAAADQAGRSIAGAGDVNGDGLDDLIVGAPFGDDGGSYAGEAYVVFGKAAGFGTTVGSRQVVDLTSLAADQGFVIQGDSVLDQAGRSVAKAGDINGDGFADLIVGAPGGYDGGAYAGEACVVFGGAAGFGTAVGGRRVVDLTTLSASQGFIIQGDAAFDDTGTSVSEAGDVNGDGFADLIVGASGGDDGGSEAGEAYVVFGGGSGFGTAVGGRQVIDLTTLSAIQGFVIQGDASGDFAGLSVSAAGDVNGDRIADLIVGAQQGDDGGSDAGEAYVLFGGPGGFGTAVGGRQVIDLTSLSSSQGFVIQGDTAADIAGRSVSGAGDINGDGFADLIVGAPFGDDGGLSAGEAYVVFGAAAGFGTTVGGRQVIDLTNLTASQGFIIQGDVTYDGAGTSVSGAGDVNGDGFDDLIIGADGGDDGGASAGEAYVLFGGPAGFTLPQIAGSAGDDVLTGSATAERLIGGRGNDVLVGNGSADVFVGGAGDDVVDVGSGSFARIDGGNGDDTMILQGSLDLTNLGRGLISGIDRIVLGDADTLALDRAVIQAVSDHGTLAVAGDGILSAVGAWIEAGAVQIDGEHFLRLVQGETELLLGEGIDHSGIALAPAFGTAVGGRQVIDLTSLSATQGFIVQGDAASDRAGGSVAGAGDVNGDGFDDLIVGADGGDDGGASAGEAYVVFGGAGGFGTAVAGRQVIDLTSLSAVQGFVIQGDAAGDQSGRSVAGAGDVNGDGLDDLIVGAPFGDDGGSYAGEAYVVFGKAAGFGTTVGGRQVLDLTTLAADQGFVIQGDSAFDQAGHSVAKAGDVNGDGFADLIVGGPAGYDGGGYAGEAYVLFGGAAGFGTAVGGRQVVDLTTLSASQGFLIQGDSTGDGAGTSVSDAGDVNGDGFDDLIVGANGGDDGGTDAGEAYVVFGGAGGFGTAVGGRQVIDLTTLSITQGFVIQGDLADDRAGGSVKGVGDVNGDGFADLIVGAQQGDDGGGNAGEAYVVFGGPGVFGTAVGGRQVIDLTSLTGSQGFVIQGDTAVDIAGTSVAGAGDVNGDGFADLIVGAPFGDDGGTSAGEAYVVFGGAGGFGTAVGGRRVIDLTSLTASQGFIIQGDVTYDSAGTSVCGAGDLNGDGFDDLIVGAPSGDDGGAIAGEAYVLFGGPAGFTLAQIAGGSSDNLLAGSATAERLIGGRGNDVLVGNGGADVFVGGAGDDVIDVGSGSFARIDGGTGSDTMRLEGDLDLGAVAGGALSALEVIDSFGNGPQALQFDATDVLAVGAANRDVLGTTNDNVLVLRGDGADSLSLTGFAAAASTITFAGESYDLYQVGGRVALAVSTEFTLL